DKHESLHGVYDPRSGGHGVPGRAAPGGHSLARRVDRDPAPRALRGRAGRARSSAGAACALLVLRPHRFPEQPSRPGPPAAVRGVSGAPTNGSKIGAQTTAYRQERKFVQLIRLGVRLYIGKREQRCAYRQTWKMAPYARARGEPPGMVVAGPGSRAPVEPDCERPLDAPLRTCIARSYSSRAFVIDRRL